MPLEPEGQMTIKVLVAEEPHSLHLDRAGKSRKKDCADKIFEKSSTVQPVVIWHLPESSFRFASFNVVSKMSEMHRLNYPPPSWSRTCQFYLPCLPTLPFFALQIVVLPINRGLQSSPPVTVTSRLSGVILGLLTLVSGDQKDSIYVTQASPD